MISSYSEVNNTWAVTIDANKQRYMKYLFNLPVWWWGQAVAISRVVVIVFLACSASCLECERMHKHMKSNLKVQAYRCYLCLMSLNVVFGIHFYMEFSHLMISYIYVYPNELGSYWLHSQQVNNCSKFYPCTLRTAFVRQRSKYALYTINSTA